MTLSPLIDAIAAKLRVAPIETQRDVLRYIEALATKQALQDARYTDSFDPFFGLTRNSPAFEGDPVDVQRKLRDATRR